MGKVLQLIDLGSHCLQSRCYDFLSLSCVSGPSSGFPLVMVPDATLTLCLDMSVLNVPSPLRHDGDECRKPYSNETPSHQQVGALASKEHASHVGANCHGRKIGMYMVSPLLKTLFRVPKAVGT